MLTAIRVISPNKLIKFLQTHDFRHIDFTDIMMREVGLEYPSYALMAEYMRQGAPLTAKMLETLLGEEDSPEMRKLFAKFLENANFNIDTMDPSLLEFKWVSDYVEKIKRARQEVNSFFHGDESNEYGYTGEHEMYPELFGADGVVSRYL
jgi:hypothetical protein